MTVTLPAATIRLVKGVVALLDTARDDPLYYERAQGLLEACKVALVAIGQEAEGCDTKTTPVAVHVRGDLGRRIARLAFEGKGTRQIARILGVAPSTVSRTLRRQEDPGATSA
jgi:hypothetical protein